MTLNATAWDRFWPKVDATGVCWEWTGSIGTKGYGMFHAAGTLKVRSHRAAYEMLVGPIPEGMTIDHLCRNKRCVNPDHFDLVTSGENTLRGGAMSARYARRTHCINGHEYTPENTRRWGGRRGRYCLACEAMRREERRRRLRGAA